MRLEACASEEKKTQEHSQEWLCYVGRAEARHLHMVTE